MSLSMVTAYGVFLLFIYAVTVKMKLSVISRMLSHILQSCHDLKSGAWRIKPLGSPVKELSLVVGLVRKGRPVLGQCVRVIAWL